MNMRNPKWATLLGAAFISGSVAAQTLTLTGPDGQTRDPALTTLASGFGSLTPANNTRSAPRATSGTTRTVRTNETLWRIANEVRPDEGVTVYQVMLALFQANPHAFSEDNLNSLERNMVLTVPSRSVMASIPADAAKARAVNDDKTWRSGSSSSSASSGASGGSELARLKSDNASLSAQLAEAVRAKSELEQKLAQQSSQSADPEQMETLRTELDNSVSELTMMLEQNEMLKRRVDELSAENGQLTSALDEQQALNRQLEQQINEIPEPEPVPPPPPPSFWQTLASNFWLLLLIGLVPALLVGLVAFMMIRRQNKAIAEEPPIPAAVEPVVAPINDAVLDAPNLGGADPLSMKADDNLGEGLSLDDLLAAHEKQVGKDSFDTKMFDDADIEALLSDSETKPRSEPKSEPSPAPAAPQPAAEPKQESKPASAPVSDDPFIDIESLLDDSNINKTGVSESRYDDGNASMGGGDYVEDESTVNAKLDLARAYIEIADFDSAKALLKEVADGGNAGQKAEAEKLLAKL